MASVDDLVILARGSSVFAGPKEDAWAVVDAARRARRRGLTDVYRAGGHGVGEEEDEEEVVVGGKEHDDEEERHWRAGNVADHLLTVASERSDAYVDTDGTVPSDEDPAADPAAQQFIEDSAQLARKAGTAAAAAAPQSSQSYAADGMTGFTVLFRRFFLVALQDPLVYGLRTAMIMFMSVIIGILYFRIDDSYESISDLISFYFFSTLVTTFVSLTALPACIDDRAVLGHEYGNKYYRLGSYIAANLAVRLVAIVVIDTAFALVTFYLVGVGAGDPGQFAVFLATLILANCFAEVLMLIIGSLIPLAVAGIALGVTIYGFFMLMSGAFVPPARMPTPMSYVTFLSYYKYAIEALMINGMDSRDYACPATIAALTGPACSISGSEVLDSVYGRGGSYFMPSSAAGIGALAGFTAVAVLAYTIVLRKTLRRSIFQ
jgi:ABC-type multidrug transport system permease subunit